MGLAILNGVCVDEDEVSLSVKNQVFEHGIGLFETFRTYHRQAPLADYHMCRLKASARELGLHFDLRVIPRGSVFFAYMMQGGFREDRRVRVTLAGSTDPNRPGSILVTFAPLPPEPPEGGIRVEMVPWTISYGDPLARHKTLNYWSKRLAAEAVQKLGADEGLLATDDGRIWEGTRSNLWLRQGSTWITPSVSGPVLPGIFRQWMHEHARQLSVKVVQADLRLGHLLGAEELAMSNSVRGLVPIGVIAGREVPAKAEGFPGVRRWNEAFRDWVGRKGARG